MAGGVENGRMIPAGLVELALRPWGRSAPGVIVDRTPERIVTLAPDFPIPGPNNVARVRCAPERVGPVVAEARALASARGLRCMWIMDPGVQPSDLAERLAALGMTPREEVDVMVLPAGAEVGETPGVEVVDALRDEATFAQAEAAQVAGFGVELVRGQRSRYASAAADPARRFLLALVDGEPAGAGWATIHPDGVLMAGGAVAPPFRGRGVYRALVAARLALARSVGAPGLGVQARPDTSGPILSRLGFVTVGRWQMLDDEA